MIRRVVGFYLYNTVPTDVILGKKDVNVDRSMSNNPHTTACTASCFYGDKQPSYIYDTSQIS